MAGFTAKANLKEKKFPECNRIAKRNGSRLDVQLKVNKCGQKALIFIYRK